MCDCGKPGIMNSEVFCANHNQETIEIEIEDKEKEEYV